MVSRSLDDCAAFWLDDRQQCHLSPAEQTWGGRLASPWVAVPPLEAAAAAGPAVAAWRCQL